jgi:hypothetical protein
MIRRESVDEPLRRSIGQSSSLRRTRSSDCGNRVIVSLERRA